MTLFFLLFTVLALVFTGHSCSCCLQFWLLFSQDTLVLAVYSFGSCFYRTLLFLLFTVLTLIFTGHSCSCCSHFLPALSWTFSSSPNDSCADNTGSSTAYYFQSKQILSIYGCALFWCASATHGVPVPLMVLSSIYTDISKCIWMKNGALSCHARS